MSPPERPSEEERVPQNVRVRAMRYRPYVSESQASAAAMRDLGYSNSDVADALGVSSSAASSYYSKFNSNVGNILPFVLSTVGGSKHVCSWQIVPQSNSSDEYWFIVKAFSNDEEFEDARGTSSAGDYCIPRGEVSLIKVVAGAASFEASTTKYDSIETLAEEVYETVTFDSKVTAQNVRGLLTEAGLPETDVSDVRLKMEGK